VEQEEVYERRDDTSFHRMVLRHEKDLYHGNGKPALTERMALMEKCVAGIENRLISIDEKTDSMNAKITQLTTVDGYMEKKDDRFWKIFAVILAAASLAISWVGKH